MICKITNTAINLTHHALFEAQVHSSTIALPEVVKPYTSIINTMTNKKIPNAISKPAPIISPHFLISGGEHKSSPPDGTPFGIPTNLSADDPLQAN